MLLAAAAVAVVLGAEPQCPDRVDIRSCDAGYDSGRLSLARHGALPASEAADVLCRPEAQAHRDSCHSTCALRLVVTQVAFEKRLAKPLTVSCLLEKRDTGGNAEWMYALEEMAAADPQAAWNKCAAAVFDKNWEVCPCDVSTVPLTQEAAKLTPMPPENEDAATVRLVRAVDEKAYTPDVILCH